MFKKIAKMASLFSYFKNKPQGPTSTSIIKAEALTHTGLVRANNEDSYLYLPEYQLWAVADGMGGHEGGEVASAIAISNLKTAIASGQNLIAAIQYSHHAIRQAAMDGLGSTGMGSTIVVIQVKKDAYQIAWVGDSRAYLYRSELECLTKDHSYIQLMLDQGLISDDDMENHPYKNAITQALGGADKPITVDMTEGTLQNGDIFLLCSDGLSGKVSAHNIALVLSSHTATLSEKADCLVQKALEAGGDDNITLILLEAEGAC
ncbi:MAG: protein phosphatase 2C domain-containing protein [Nitrosomonas sp.]|nr:protein phosphatase 2C domain-containing protein [Nitrosomonas sp.]